MPYVYHLGQLKNLWVFPTLMSPPSFEELFHRAELLRNTFEVSWETIFSSSLRNTFWIFIYSFQWKLMPFSHRIAHNLLFIPLAGLFPPPHSASTESVTLGRSLKVAIPSRVLQLTFSLRGSLLWGSFSKSVVLDAWAWCDWCRHLSPGVIVIAISVTVSAGFPLHYLKRALDVCNCSTVNNRYQKE